VIRVLLADDQAPVRSGFRGLAGSAPDIEVVGEAADGAAAVDLALNGLFEPTGWALPSEAVTAPYSAAA
jgi:DNA-binding NarL/FixJ family response regulator